jgi:hypothetical protein
VEVVANGAHDHLAGVETDPDLHLETMLAAHLIVIAPNGLLHGQRRIARPHGMVFKGDRRPKQGHDAIAHDLIHRSLVAMHGCHHALQHRIKELPGLLGIAVGQQLHGAFEIREQHGDLLALPFEGTAGGEDVLGEIRRGIGAWATRLVDGCGSPRRRGRMGCSSPDQATALIIDHVGVEEFLL